jgi:reductive dehalogenase
MLFRDHGYNRGVELGPYPLDALDKDPALIQLEADAAPRPAQASRDVWDSAPPLGQVARRYGELFANCSNNPPAPIAPVPDDLARRSQEIKGAAYYLDAAHAGICEIPSNAWRTEPLAHTHAVTIWVEYGRDIEPDNLAHHWLNNAKHDVAQMRGLEIGISIVGHIRALGFAADIHYADGSAVDLDRLAVLAGIGRRVGANNDVASPFFGLEYASTVITTDYALATDTPLASNATLNKLRYWWGANGATSGREMRRSAKRASHLSRYPMEQVDRVERPTTLILDDEIPRVPKRAEFFMRARSGDLGNKAQQEVKRFAFKHPLTDGMMKPLRAMVPHQNGEVADHLNPELTDPDANTRAIKSLSYHLGADLTGICEIPDYAWYSHGPDGKPIEIKHKYAVVMLIDQGYDTMEGASGDDWISGCQSMRGYIRGAEIAGIMGDFLRSQGVSARAQTNADSEVLQIPLVLWAGLGELSRIGELVLNPFVGPRFKSVVLTTNLPLVPDKPVDFGLQAFCGNCLKCARECPVNAIPFGDKVMYNGYEIWKPDVERCTRYRVTNPKGSACGRCMKTCPLNKVVSADGALAHRVGTWLGINVRWLKPLMVPIAVYLDDKLGYGKRNPKKRWWLDLELVDGKAQIPSGTNERDLDVSADTSGKKSPVGYYHASDYPPPDTTEPVLANHKAAVERAAMLETVEQARQRHAAGGAPPVHYIPTKTLDEQETRT